MCGHVSRFRGLVEQFVQRALRARAVEACRQPPSPGVNHHPPCLFPTRYFPPNTVTTPDAPLGPGGGRAGSAATGCGLPDHTGLGGGGTPPATSLSGLRVARTGPNAGKRQPITADPLIVGVLDRCGQLPVHNFCFLP